MGARAMDRLGVGPRGLAWLVVAMVMPTLTGCLTAAATSGQPTAIERQLLGAYEALDDDLVRASSVRGGRDGLSDEYGSVRELALEQRAVQRFNEDDLLELKGSRCIAETRGVRVVARSCEARRADSAVERRLTRVVAEENRAREAILRWAAYEVARARGRARPGSEVRIEVEEAFRRLILDAAAPGHLVEREEGHFEEAGPGSGSGSGP